MRAAPPPTAGHTFFTYPYRRLFWQSTSLSNHNQAFKNTTTDDLLAPVLQAVVERSGVDPASLGDIVIGNVLQAGSGAVSARWVVGVRRGSWAASHGGFQEGRARARGRALRTYLLTFDSNPPPCSMAQFYAGIPHTVPLATINRQVRTHAFILLGKSPLARV